MHMHSTSGHLFCMKKYTAMIEHYTDSHLTVSGISREAIVRTVHVGTWHVT